MDHYKAIVIGAGQAGVPLARKLAEQGWRTCLIEKHLVGGTCVNDGCTPTKAMIASASIAHLARNAEDLGIHIPSVEVDFERVIKRKSDIVSSFREGSERRIQQTENLTFIAGEASFVDAHHVEVECANGERRVLHGHVIFINTGGRPFIPDITGLSEVPYYTSTTLLELRELPEHLVILGGGYIALEFAQMYRRFGSKVSILEQSERILKKEDADVATCIHEILTADGIEIYTETTVKLFQKHHDQVRVVLEKDEVMASHMLVATGRIPNSEKLNLDKTKVVTDKRGHIQVNEKLETAEPHIYALGDVNGGPAFTHISYNDHLIVYKNIVEHQHLTTDDRTLCFCMFTDPQLARVGFTEQEARKKGYTIGVAKLPMSHVARALETGRSSGFMKAVVDRSSGKILGATVIGAEGGEIMSLIQIAMKGNLSYQSLRDGVFAHPTYAESLNNLFAKLE